MGDLGYKGYNRDYIRDYIRVRLRQYFSMQVKFRASYSPTITITCDKELISVLL